MALMTLLEDLAIFIPTYNRHAYVTRSMRYWGEKGLNVHVLDGTEVPIEKRILEDCRDTNIHYHHMPCTIEERFGNAARLANTPYVVCLCDDEFFIPSALERCVKTLNEQGDIGACTGLCLGFYPLKKEVSALPEYSGMRNYKNVRSSANERMITYVTNRLPSTFYAVQRVGVWKNSMNLVASHPSGFSSPYMITVYDKTAS